MIRNGIDSSMVRPRSIPQIQAWGCGHCLISPDMTRQHKRSSNVSVRDDDADAATV